MREVNVEIAAGSHVAVVGSSGAGKSTLVGLLLGWHRADEGELRIDGRPLSSARLDALRRQTAWVDPAVRLWNSTLMDNLTYGNTEENLGLVIERALLEEVLKTLPDGLQSTLGEGGALVSGGEGQRVRLARAMMRRQARLVILDEPFRGLDRATRNRLLRRSRELWRHATLLYVTHDLHQTLAFDQVLVIDHGRVIEQGPPQGLARKASSRYRALLEMEGQVRERLWSNASWRRLWLQDGRLQEQVAEEPSV
ncbi:MAG: ABC transporter ATP-binding protein [Acidobacteria bacterium]|nr:ABC transporter ATP-binding protein [Acidobacteriota bacterium]